MTIIAKPDFPAKDVKEMIDYVKNNKSKVTYANAGIGSASHLCGLLFLSAIQADITTVPYKGTGPAMNDILGGQVDFMCDQTTNTTGQIKGGRVKAFAVTSKSRLPSLPDLPTVAESGLPGFEVNVWHGLWAPKGTPKAVVDKLTASAPGSAEGPDVHRQDGRAGRERRCGRSRPPRCASRSFAQAEIARWGPIIKKAGVYAD